eukprot:gene47321-25648_t
MRGRNDTWHDLGGESIWATGDKRELVCVKGIQPPTHHHSLIAELGQTIKRFREFVIFRSDRVLSDYLLAYQRA